MVDLKCSCPVTEEGTFITGKHSKTTGCPVRIELENMHPFCISTAVNGVNLLRYKE